VVGGHGGVGAVSRPSGSERMRRVLAMIPWVVARDGATVDEIAAQFGTTARTVERDLSLAKCCEVGANLDHVAMWVDEDGRVYAGPVPTSTGPGG
jgi:proteasome accessory factor C